MDENDYPYIEILARGLEDGSLLLSDQTWDPASGWSRERAIAALAVCVYMADERRRATASNDEDAAAKAANDHASLRAIFRLEDRANPFSAFDQVETNV